MRNPATQARAPTTPNTRHHGSISLVSAPGHEQQQAEHEHRGTQQPTEHGHPQTETGTSHVHQCAAGRAENVDHGRDSRWSAAGRTAPDRSNPAVPLGGRRPPLLSAPMTARPPSRRVLVALTVVATAGLLVGACSSGGGTRCTRPPPTRPRPAAFRSPSSTPIPPRPSPCPSGAASPSCCPPTPPTAGAGSSSRSTPGTWRRSGRSSATIRPCSNGPPPPRPPLPRHRPRQRPSCPASRRRPPSRRTPPTAPSTTTTAPGPLVQIISYAGRSAGVTTVTLRYERIGTGQDAPEAAQTLVFNVLVGTPPPPPASAPPAGLITAGATLAKPSLRRPARDPRRTPHGAVRGPPGARSPGATPSSNSSGRMARSMAIHNVRDHGKKAKGTTTAATAGGDRDRAPSAGRASRSRRRGSR